MVLTSLRYTTALPGGRPYTKSIERNYLLFGFLNLAILFSLHLKYNYKINSGKGYTW